MKITKIIPYLLYILLFTTAFNPIFTYLFKISELHFLVLMLILFLTIATILKQKKIIFKRIDILIFIYACTVLVGVINIESNINFIIKALTYRIVFPLLFVLVFLVLYKEKNINKLGYNIIKVVNVICIIIAVFGIVEIIYPQIIYKLYGNSLTQHLSLLINGKVTSRLISVVANPINLGFYMSIGIGSAMTLILINFKKSKLFVILEVFFILLFTYIMFLTYSRSAILTTCAIGLFIFIFQLKRTKMKHKIIVLILASFVCLFVGEIIFNIDSISSRIETISLESYFKNTRFLRAYLAFSEETNLFQFLFGHGITQLNSSGAYVFEFGFASLLYESGLFGFLLVISCYFYGLLIGIKNKCTNSLDLYVKDFYVVIIISGLAGMLVEDLYMQQPYSIFLWFSTIFLIARGCKIKYVNS